MAIATYKIELVYRQTLHKAMGLAVTLLHDEEDARDVVQEVFARLMERQQTDSMTMTNPEAFIYRSVRNACINRIKMMETRERIKRLLPIENEEIEDLTEERIAVVQEAAEQLLSEREGEVVRGIFSEGLTYREAAEELGVSVAAINKHIVNALRKLRKHFNSRES